MKNNKTKIKKIKNTKTLNCNDRSIRYQLVKKIYDSIYTLDTNTLKEHIMTCTAELISRIDYNEIDFLMDKYFIIRDELIRRGVNIDV